MTVTPSQQFLGDKFPTLSAVEMRERGLEAIRLITKHRNPTPGHHAVGLHEWFDALVGQWIPVKDSGDPNILSVWHVLNYVGKQKLIPETETLVYPHQMRVLQFWQWMEQAGFAVRTNGDAWAITSVGVTRLESDHPCRPGAMARLRGRFVPEFEDSISRLEDAHECFERSLYRPTLMLLGLAWENMLDKVAAKRGINVAKSKAADRILALRKSIANDTNSEAKGAAMDTLSIADSIRSKRNDASHEASSKIDAVVVDETLTLGTQFYDRLAGYVPY